MLSNGYTLRILSQISFALLCRQESGSMQNLFPLDVLPALDFPAPSRALFSCQWDVFYPIVCHMVSHFSFVYSRCKNLKAEVKYLNNLHFILCY